MLGTEWEFVGRGGGGGGAGYVISMGLEYFQKFLDNLCKRRVILEGVKIFLKFYISLEVVPIKQIDVVGESGLK